MCVESTRFGQFDRNGNRARHFYHLERPSKLPVCDFVVCCLLTARLCMFPVVLLNLDVIHIFRPLPLLDEFKSFRLHD